MPSVTLSTFETRVYNRLDGNNLMFPLNEVDDAINEGLRVAQCFAAYQMGGVTLPNYTDTGRVIYDVPPVISVPLAVYFNGRALRFRSLASLASEYRNWACQNSSFAGQTSNWAPIGVKAFVIHPADGVGGNSLEVFGVMDLAPLVNEADTAALPDEFESLIADYAVMCLLTKMPGKFFTSGLEFYKSWQNRMKKLAKWRVDSMPGYQRRLRGVAA